MVKKIPKHLPLGNRIKEAIDSSGKKQGDIAKALGVESPHLTRWIKGMVAPSYETIIKIGNETGVSLDWLLTGEEPSTPPAYPPEIQRYVDKLVSVLTGPDQRLAGKVEGFLDALPEGAEKEPQKKGA